jgi:hypothetical protein
MKNSAQEISMLAALALLKDNGISHTEGRRLTKMLRADKATAKLILGKKRGSGDAGKRAAYLTNWVKKET